MKTFAAVPGMLAGAGRARSQPTSSGLSVEDVRQIAVVEARRLRAGKDLPTYERRDLLADLASRLAVLIEGQTDQAYEALHALVGVLTGDGDLEMRWASAITALEAFGGSAEPDRKPFWKR
jgi:Ca-activated chloride channel family protein